MAVSSEKDSKGLGRESTFALKFGLALPLDTQYSRGGRGVGHHLPQDLRLMLLDFGRRLERGKRSRS